jgi:hypothetical protein
MDQLQRLRHIYDEFPRVVISTLIGMVTHRCGRLARQANIPILADLQRMYPNHPGNLFNLLDLFHNDMGFLAEELVRIYGCDELNNNIAGFVDDYLNGDHDDNGSSLFSNDSSNTRMSMEGGKFTYKGRKYVIRNGSRSGKYILVKNKKVYLSQI